MTLTTLLYRCPTTGLTVQGGFPGDAKEGEDTYEAVTCPACGQMHFVNRTTGRTLSVGESKSKK